MNQGPASPEQSFQATANNRATTSVALFYPGQNRFGSRREDLVKQAEHGNEQQADERPDDLGEGVHLRSERDELCLQPVDLSLQPIDLCLHLRPEFGDLSLHFRPELSDLSLHVGPELGDLGSDGGDDVLPTQATHLFNGGMDQLGVPRRCRSGPDESRWFQV